MAVALVSKILVGLGDGPEWGGGLDTIWAFCFRTSAGVRMKQETSSPDEEARELVIGLGMGVDWRRDLVDS